MIGKYRKFFFPHVRLSIRRFLQKIWRKTLFFRILQNVKKRHLTRKIPISPRILREYWWGSGFGSKIPRAFFCTIQNTIWTQIDRFTDIWKFYDFDIFRVFFMLFLLLKSKRFLTFCANLTVSFRHILNKQNTILPHFPHIYATSFRFWVFCP